MQPKQIKMMLNHTVTRWCVCGVKRRGSEREKKLKSGRGMWDGDSVISRQWHFIYNKNCLVVSIVSKKNFAHLSFFRFVGSRGSSSSSREKCPGIFLQQSSVIGHLNISEICIRIDQTE